MPSYTHIWVSDKWHRAAGHSTKLLSAAFVDHTHLIQRVRFLALPNPQRYSSVLLAWITRPELMCDCLHFLTLSAT